MRRKGLGRCVRSVIEGLESRVLFDSVSVGTGTSSIVGTVKTDGGLPIPVATVYIDLNNDHTLDAGDPNVVTDATGGFSFTQIANSDVSTGAPINYRLEVVAQPGFQQDAPGYVDVVLPTNAASTTNPQAIDIRESSAPGISGLLFYDVNEDGVYEFQTDTPLAGDTVYVDANGDGKIEPGEPAAITSATGLFNIFEPIGIYQVRVVPRAGFRQDPPGFINVTLGNSDQAIGNIGETNFSSIGGTVFLDLNGNGIQDGAETGVAGETVDVFDDTGALAGSTTTDATGQYFLATLNPGKYQLAVFTSGSNGYVEGGLGYVDVTLPANQDFGVNVGEGMPASVSGVVFDDKNGNGTKDANEPGLANQTVYLDITNNGAFNAAGSLDPNGQILPFDEPNAVTDANGNYTIGNVGSGTYTARLVAPSGIQATAPANPSHSFTFTLGSGQSLTNQNFGFKTPDLTITAVHFPIAPAFGNVDQTAVFRIVNVGSLIATGTTEIGIYVSPLPVFSVNSSTLLGETTPAEVSLKPGKSKTFKIHFLYPATQASGLYYVTGQVFSSVQDNNTANDTTPAIGPVQVTKPILDLSLAYAAQPQASVAPGVSTVLSVVVVNNGNVTTTAPLTFRVYIAKDNFIEPNDVVAQSFTFSKKVKIGPGASKLYHLVLNSPGVNSGARFPIIYVDSGDPLGEQNTANNMATPLASTLFLG